MGPASLLGTFRGLVTVTLSCMKMQRQRGQVGQEAGATGLPSEPRPGEDVPPLAGARQHVRQGAQTVASCGWPLRILAPLGLPTTCLPPISKLGMMKPQVLEQWRARMAAQLGAEDGLETQVMSQVAWESPQPPAQGQMLGGFSWAQPGWPSLGCGGQGWGF